MAYGQLNSLKQEESSKPFYFVQITDMHCGVNDNDLRAQKIVKSINELPVDIAFVAETGDITENKLEDPSVVSNAVAILSQLKAPVYHVPGNHDIIPGKFDVTAAIYKENFGDLLVEKEYNGVISIFVYTEPLAKNFKIPGFDPLKQLQESLIRADGKPVLIFHHTPSVEDFYANTMHAGWDPEIRDQWVELLNAYNVKAVFTGHFHRDELHWLGNVPLYVSSSAGDTMNRQRQATYRLYEYKDGHISYRTQYLK
jgi:3',5'-cyclic AMP phosphodiesterase CpdA